MCLLYGNNARNQKTRSNDLLLYSTRSFHVNEFKVSYYIWFFSFSVQHMRKLLSNFRWHHFHHEAEHCMDIGKLYYFRNCILIISCSYLYSQVESRSTFCLADIGWTHLCHHWVAGSLCWNSRSHWQILVCPHSKPGNEQQQGPKSICHLRI